MRRQTTSPYKKRKIRRSRLSQSDLLRPDDTTDSVNNFPLTIGTGKEDKAEQENKTPNSLTGRSTDKSIESVLNIQSILNESSKENTPAVEEDVEANNNNDISMQAPVEEVVVNETMTAQQEVESGHVVSAESLTTVTIESANEPVSSLKQLQSDLGLDHEEFNVKHERTRKRVPAKLIDTLWNPVEYSTLNAIENVLYICLNRTMENYDERANLEGLFSNTSQPPSSALVRRSQKKLLEAKTLLTKNWIDSNDPKSFMSRLKVTKLPSKTSLVSGTSVTQTRSEADSDPMLSYDQLRRHKQLVESYLLAEMKQLHELERTYKRLQGLYELDRKYLNDYKRIVEADNKRMLLEITNNRALLGIDAQNELASKTVIKNATSRSTFRPENDTDVQDILRLFQTKLAGNEVLSQLTRRLDGVYNILNNND